MFKKPHIDALLEELEKEWGKKPVYENLLRDAHLGIAYFDAGRRLTPEIDTRVIELICKHKPKTWGHTQHIPLKKTTTAYIQITLS